MMSSLEFRVALMSATVLAGTPLDSPKPAPRLGFRPRVCKSRMKLVAADYSSCS